MRRWPVPIALPSLLLSLAVSLATGPLAGPAAAQQADWADSLRAQLQAGRLEAALQTAREATAQAPGNPALWYNLAGLEQQVGDPAAAAVALGKAVVHGFTDFRFADADADLGELRRAPVYRQLREAWARSLADRAEARALTLTAGQWSEPIALPDRTGGLTPPVAEARLRVGTGALEVEVRVTGDAGPTRPPWRGGSGVFLWVGAPQDAAEGRGGTEIAVGLAEQLPVGAVRLGPRWQRLAELTPKLRALADGSLSYEFAVPWQACRPLHPLVDQPLLVNLTVVTEPEAAVQGTAAWLADPATGRSDRPWRRGVPVRVAWTSDSAPALQGRLSDHLLRGQPLQLTPLAALVADDGPASARLVLRDRTGEVAWQRTLELPGRTGRRTALMSESLDVPAGSLRLGASLDGPGVAGPVTWETELVHLPPGWEERTAARIAAAPAAEQASLRWRLDAVREVASRPESLDAILALGSTVDELEALLDRVAATGTSLPAGGRYLAAVPSADAQDPLPCCLSLPDGWQPGDPARVLLLLARAPGAADRAVTMTPRLLAERAERAGTVPPPLVLAYPQLPIDHHPARARATAGRLLDWLQGFLDAGPVHVAGVDLLAATAFELAAERPEAVAAVLALTGMDFVPYPGAGPEAFRARVAELPAGLSVGWYWFPDEQGPDDQAAPLREALAGAGLSVAPAEPVAGGLDANQAWMRAVVWAAGLTD